MSAAWTAPHIRRGFRGTRPRPPASRRPVHGHRIEDDARAVAAGDFLHLLHQVFFLSGDHVRGAQRKQFLRLFDPRVPAIAVAPSAFTIWMAARPTLLEAAVISTKSPRLTPPIRDQRAISRQILHPYGRRFDGRKLRWIFAERIRGDNRFFAQHAVLAHREAGDGSHRLAHPARIHARAQRLRRCRRLHSQFGRQLEAFRSMNPRMNAASARFNPTACTRSFTSPSPGSREGHFFEFQILWTADTVEANDLRHAIYFGHTKSAIARKVKQPGSRPG